MAARYYVGTDGNWNTTANWSATRGGASGVAVPVTGDDVWVENLDHALSSNVTGHTAVDLESLTISLAPGGSIGAAGGSLTIAVSNSASSKMRVTSRGGGSVYFTAGTAGVDLLNLMGTGGSEFIHTGGTIAAAYLGQTGVYRVKSGATNTAISTTGASVIVESGAGNMSTFRALAGSAVVDDTQISAASVFGGKLLMTGDSNISTSVYVSRGGVYVHKSSGTIAEIDVLPGGTASAYGAIYPFTVTNSYWGVGGSLFEDSDVDITYSNAPVKIGFSS